MIGKAPMKILRRFDDFYVLLVGSSYFELAAFKMKTLPRFFLFGTVRQEQKRIFIDSDNNMEYMDKIWLLQQRFSDL